MKINMKIGEKKFDFFFGLGYLGETLEVLGFDIGELGDKMIANPFKYIPVLMYHSINYGYEKRSEVLDLTIDDLIDLLDDNGGIFNESAQTFQKQLMKTLTKDIPKEKEIEGAKKK